MQYQIGLNEQFIYGGLNHIVDVASVSSSYYEGIHHFMAGSISS